MKQIIKNAAIWGCTIIVLIIVALSVGPTVEQELHPSFTNIQATITKIDDNEMRLIATGKKARSGELSNIQVTVFFNGQWVQGSIVMLDKDGLPLSVANHKTATGETFVRVAVVKPAGTAVRVVTISRQHPFWLSKQNLFELDITKTPQQVYP